MRNPWARCLALLTLLAVVALVGVASAAVTFTPEHLAGGGLSTARDPETSGSLAVWTGSTAITPNSFIRVHDFAADSAVNIGTGSDSIDQRLADVSLGRIVYEYDDGGDADIRMWDSWLNLHMPIAETADEEVGPRIDGNLIVWYVPAADELRYRDLGRGIVSAVVPDAQDVEYWDIDNGAIIWSHQAAANSDRVRRFRPGIDAVSLPVVNVFDNRDITSLRIHGNTIAYTVERVDGGDEDAMWGNISRDSAIQQGPVDSENLFEERDPVVFHRDVAWETNKMGSWDTFARTVLPERGDMAIVAGGASDTADDTDMSMFGHRVAYEYRAGLNPTEVWLSTAAPDVARTAGDDRYLTAVEASKAYFMYADDAVLCTGLNYPDALAAAPLARLLRGPLLLTRTALVDAATMAEFDRLGVDDVYLIGGPDVVSNGVWDQIVAAGMTPHRIYGDDRYATSVAVAEEMASRLSGVYAPRRAFFARGDNFPDALAVGPVASSVFSPIILVRTAGVPDVVAAAVDDLNLTSGIIVGGSDVVSEGVRGDLRDLMVANGGDDHDPMLVERWSGATRYETALAIVENGLEARWIDLDTLGIATGLNFPDALGGGTALGSYGSPLLLTKATSVPDSVSAFLDDHEYQIGRVDVFGGADVVSDSVKAAIAAKLK